MATIVYEGAGGAGGGDLFKDIKFYFLLRVPSRQRWMELVQSNGGELVKLEKQADIVIADHARKDCPAGSISWKYVEESVKKGVLEEIDDHRAGPVTHTAREVGSGGPTRKGRTPFTTQDDEILMKWVMKGERSGIAAKGNELFQQLEEKNPRHTYQSWRDRWIKYVQYRPRPEEADGSQSQSDDPTPAPKSTKTKSKQPKSHASSSSRNPELRRQETQPHQASSSSRQAYNRSPASLRKPSKGKEPEQSSTNPLVIKSAGGVHFTSSEIKLLVELYEDIVNIDKDKEIDAWATWAVQNPNHTAQEWRNYFVKQLTPMILKNKKNQSKQAIRSPKPNPTPRGTEISRNLVAHFDTPEIEIADSQPVREEPIDPTLEDEELFEEGLSVLAEEIDVKEITFSPTICGRQISLFQLWQVVKSHSFGGHDRVTGLHLWPQVARKLNFHKSQIVNAAEDLEACYGEILADFEMARDQYLASLESQPSEDQPRSTTAGDDPFVDIEQPERNDLEEEDFDDDLNAPLASPASHSSAKRNMAYRASQGLSSVAGSAKKRQRIDKGKGKEREIPSTPDVIINSNQMQPRLHQPSPLKSFQAIDDQNEEESDEEFFMKPFKRPDFSFLKTRHKPLEPETQDFQFDYQEDECEELEGNFTSSAPLVHRDTRGSQSKYTVPVADVLEGSSTQSQTESQHLTELKAYIDRNISLGYSEEIVYGALDATSMDTGDAAYVMEALTQTGRIPENVQGVWTVNDDAALEDEGSPEFARIVGKHGGKRIELRRKFLDDQREAKRRLDNEEE